MTMTSAETTMAVRSMASALVFALICETPVRGSTGPSSAFGVPGIGEYCHGEAFTAGCAGDEVIVLRNAFYGLMRSGRCVKGSYVRPGCQENVQRQADRLCSGRRTCRIQVTGRLFGGVVPCQISAKFYLEVSYECQKVLTVVAPNCNVEKFALVRDRSGLLSSLIAEERGQGSVACPWRIELPRGERINVTLIDFSTPTPDHHHQGQGQGQGQGGGETATRVCLQYALVTEKLSTVENRRVCGGDRREVHAYTSRTNSIEIRIITKKSVESDRNHYFLLKYEAIGCSIPQAPRLGWMVRDSDGILMGCNHTDKTWRLHCDGNRWNGRPENCSVNGKYDKSIMVWKNVTVPESVVLVVIGALVVIAVIIIALLSLICIEWRKSKDQQLTRRGRTPGSTGRDPQPTSSSCSAPSGKQFQNHHHHHHRSSRTRYDSLKPTTADCPSSSSSGDPLDPSTAHQRPSSGPRDDNDYYAAEGEGEGERASSSPTSRDYLREMWPMALPPGNVTGNALVVKETAEPANDTSTFQYGDSVTMTTTTTKVATHKTRGVGASIDGGVGGVGEYDTHIYETPKYLRREKAATLRLKGTTKTHRGFEGEEGKGEKEEAEGGRVSYSSSSASSSARRHSAHAHSKTLPRDSHLAATTTTGR